MATPFVPASSGGRKSPFVPDKKKKGSSGVFGFVENLAGDLKDAAFGFFPGLYHLAKDPIKSGKAIGVSEWQSWSPLFSGHFGQFGHQLYSHPLGPLLDVATVVTLGGSAVGKATNIATAGELTSITKAGGKVAADMSNVSKAAAFGRKRTYTIAGAKKGEPSMGFRHVSGNPVVRARQEATYKFTSYMGETLPDWTGARRFTDRGRYEHAMRKQRAYAKGVTSAAMQGQLAALVRLGDDMEHNANAVAMAVDDIARTNFIRSGMRIDPQDLIRKSRRRKPGEGAAVEDLARTSERNLAEGKANLADFEKRSAAGEDFSTFTGETFHPEGGATLYKHRDPFSGKETWSESRLSEHMGLNQKVPVGRPGTKYVTKGRLAPGYRFLKKDAPTPPSHVTTFEEYQKWVESIGARHVTDDVAKAFMDEDGKYVVVNNHTVKLYGEEAANASKTLKVLYSQPVRVWKYMVLGVAPRYFVNNVVGNYLMYALATGPKGIRGYVDALRQVHSERAVMASMSKADRMLAKKLGVANNVVDKYYMGLYRQGFGHETAMEMGGVVKDLRIGSMSRTARVIDMGAKGFYPATHAVAEKFLRRASVNMFLRNSDEVRALVRGGKSFEAASEIMSKDMAFRSRIVEQVNNVLGDYHYMNNFERGMRQLIPFYTWDRAIMRHGVNLALERPATAMAMAALGRQYSNDLTDKLGEIPDFLKNVIILGNGKDGRINVITTQGLNPYSTIPSVVDTARALVGLGKDVSTGEAIASQANPLITGLIQQVTGQSLLSGARLPKPVAGGILGGVLQNTFETTPLPKLLKVAIQGAPKPRDPNKPFMYRKDLEQEALAFLGIPLKGLNLEAAHRTAKARNR